MQSVPTRLLHAVSNAQVSAHCVARLSAQTTALPAAGFVNALLANVTLVADLVGRPVGRAPPPGVLAAAEAAGLNVASLRTLLRDCGDEGCARAVTDMLELHSLMARRGFGSKLDAPVSVAPPFTPATAIATILGGMLGKLCARNSGQTLHLYLATTPVMMLSSGASRSVICEA